MYLKTIKLIALIITLSALQASAQNVTNSPYSRYGIGDLSYKGDGRSVAMGGASVADASYLYVNTVNPAANTNFLMQRFVFDVGMDVKYTNTTSSTASQKNSNATFRYLAGGFAAKPWWYFTFMFKPYSSVGYKFTDSVRVSQGEASSLYSETFDGVGGLNKLSISTSFKFFRMLSVGAQGSVLFGNLERYHQIRNVRPNGHPDGVFSTITNSVQYSDKYIMHGMQAELGLRFEKRWRSHKDTLTDALRLSLGAYLGFDSKLKTRNELFLDTYHYVGSSTSSLGYQSMSDTLACDTLYNGRMTIPGNYGLGVSVILMEKLTINADYQHQDWTKFALPGGAESSNLRENKFFGVGIQYVQNIYSSKFLPKVNYRLGFHKQETYLKFGDQGIDEKAVSFGFGIPIRTLLLNVGAEFGKRGTTERNLYEEKYFLMNFSVTVHDIWFVKRKFQ